MLQAKVTVHSLKMAAITYVWLKGFGKRDLHILSSFWLALWTFVTQWPNKNSNNAKRGRTHVTMSQVVLILHLIGPDYRSIIITDDNFVLIFYLLFHTKDCLTCVDIFYFFLISCVSFIQKGVFLWLTKICYYSL